METPRQNAKGPADSGAESRAAGASCSCECCKRAKAREAHYALMARINQRLSRDLMELRRRSRP